MKQELMAGIVIGLIGLCLLLVPMGRLWAFTEQWKSKEAGASSRGYTLLMRILGGVFAAAGAALIVYGL